MTRTRENTVSDGGIVLHGAIFYLTHRTLIRRERKFGVEYRVDHIKYWLAADPFDCSAKRVALAVQKPWA